MPIDYKLYPKNWNEISESIRQRENNRCKNCMAPNGAMIRRRKGDSFWFILDKSEAGDDHWGKPIKVVLTVAHLDHNINNNDPENLAALCQRCHLSYDAKHHAETRKKKMEALAALRNFLWYYDNIVDQDWPAKLYITDEMIEDYLNER